MFVCDILETKLPRKNQCTTNIVRPACTSDSNAEGYERTAGPCEREGAADTERRQRGREQRHRKKKKEKCLGRESNSDRHGHNVEYCLCTTKAPTAIRWRYPIQTAVAYLSRSRLTSFLLSRSSSLCVAVRVSLRRTARGGGGSVQQHLDYGWLPRLEANLVMSSSYTFYYILQGSHDSIVASISTSSSSWSASAVLVNFKMKRTVCSSVPIGSYCAYATITCQWDGHSTSLGLTVS